MGDVYPKIRVAAVQAAPVFLNREASVEKACRLIQEAGAAGAQLVGFPEGFIPAHPTWYCFHPATAADAIRLSVELFKNSVEIPSPATDLLCRAAREAGTDVVMGLCEKLPGTTGTMYNTQLFIDHSGQILGKHQKLVPTFTERLVHSNGDAATLRAFPTRYGPISGLVCGENGNPLAVFSLIAQGARVHVASWPPHNTLTLSRKSLFESTVFVGQCLAYQAKAVVINVCGTVDETMIDGLRLNDEQRNYLLDPKVCGGSTIIDPRGQIVTGPMGAEEGILYADVDLEDCVRGKLVHDFAGHYNRADVFHLNVATEATAIFDPIAATHASEEVNRHEDENLSDPVRDAGTPPASR